MDNGQPEPGALVKRAVERLKDSVELLGRNSPPLILDGQQRRTRAVLVRCGREQQPASLGHRAKPVRRQVPDHLSNLVLVRFTPDRIGGDLYGNSMVLAHLGAV